MGILTGLWTGCKSPTSPNGEGEADIIVFNDYGEDLDIYMDGTFRFTAGFKTSIEIDNVSLEEHDLEARLKASGLTVDSETIEVEEKTDYTWTVDNPPDINVINQSGISLRILLDGQYQFDLSHEENRWIIDVFYGERFLKALRADNEEEVASITLRVDENKDYSWTIE
jgi:hypothetical protein